MVDGKGLVGARLGKGDGPGLSVGKAVGPVGRGDAVGLPRVGLGVGAKDVVGEIDGEGVG